MEEKTDSRKRRKVNRYGVGDSSGNMDDIIEAIDQTKTTTTENEDTDYVDLSESSSDVSNSEPVEKTTFEKNGSQKLQERRLARFEAKLDKMHSLLIQIQRACNLTVTSSLLESNRIDELPLVSEEILNKFELDLSQDSYRQKIVSI